MLPCIAPSRDAVITAINSALPTLTTVSLTAVGVWDPYTKLTDLASGAGQVLVMPADKKTEWMTRGNVKQKSEVMIDIAVQYKIKTAPPSLGEVDPYMSLVENLEQFFSPSNPGNFLTMANSIPMTCDGVEWPMLHSPELIKADRVFSSTLRVKFLIVN